MSNRPKLRRWIIWMIIGIWIATAIVILVLVNIHPPAMASASLTVRQLSFKTTAKEILSRTNEQQLIISGVSSLEIHSAQLLKPTTGSRYLPKANSLKVRGSSLTSCSFDKVISSGLKLNGPSVVTLIWPELKDSFTLAFHGAIAGSLTSQPGTQHLVSGFRCTNVDVDGESMPSLDVELSRSGGDSVEFTTMADARLDFRGTEALSAGDTQVPISEPLRISYTEAGSHSKEEKTALLPPPAGDKNRIAFDNIGKDILVDNADLIVIVPENNFYLRQFKVDGGIVLSLHGLVEDIKVGAGVKDLHSKMPSLLDHLDAKSRVLGLIPSLAALVLGIVLGILEKLNVLPTK